MTQDSGPESRIGPLLLEANLTIVTAESCTGGLIAHLLTSQPGSSAYFLGGIISYSNELKMKLLGVQERTLISHGAVSGKTAIEMARGARQVMHADVGVSATGIAGPGGGTDTKPVGLTYIGVSTLWGDDVREFVWKGDRTENKLASAQAALAFVVEKLEAD